MTDSAQYSKTLVRVGSRVQFTPAAPFTPLKSLNIWPVCRRAKCRQPREHLWNTRQKVGQNPGKSEFMFSRRSWRKTAVLLNNRWPYQEYWFILSGNAAGEIQQSIVVPA